MQHRDLEKTRGLLEGSTRDTATHLLRIDQLLVDAGAMATELTGCRAEGTRLATELERVVIHGVPGVQRQLENTQQTLTATTLTATVGQREQREQQVARLSALYQSALDKLLLRDNQIEELSNRLAALAVEYTRLEQVLERSGHEHGATVVRLTSELDHVRTAIRSGDHTHTRAISEVSRLEDQIRVNSVLYRKMAADLAAAEDSNKDLLRAKTILQERSDSTLAANAQMALALEKAAQNLAKSARMTPEELRVLQGALRTSVLAQVMTSLVPTVLCTMTSLSMTCHYDVTIYDMSL